MNTKAELFKKKQHILQEMIDRINKWSQSSGEVEAILEKNEDDINKIKVIDEKLSQDELEEFKATNDFLLRKTLGAQHTVIQTIKEQSTELQSKMKQMNQKDKVVKHYMNKEESLFVDRDV